MDLDFGLDFDFDFDVVLVLVLVLVLAVDGRVWAFQPPYPLLRLHLACWALAELFDAVVCLLGLADYFVVFGYFRGPSHWLNHRACFDQILRRQQELVFGPQLG